MSNVETPDLQAIHDQLSAVLEERITDLMTQVKASQAVARQIARTEEEVERQRLLRERLEAELAPLRSEAAQLTAEAQSLQAELDETSDTVDRLREIRTELAALAAGPEA